LQREKDLERVRLLAEQYASEALQPIVNSGRADSIDVRAEQPESGGLILRIRVQTSAGTFDYTASHKVPLI
jgi:phage protein GP46